MPSLISELRPQHDHVRPTRLNLALDDRLNRTEMLCVLSDWSWRQVQISKNYTDMATLRNRTGFTCEAYRYTCHAAQTKCVS